LFGSSVAVSGNLVVVGTRDAGAAYLFDATSGALLRTFTNPLRASTDPSAAVYGNFGVLGARLDNAGAKAARAAGVVAATGGTLLRSFSSAARAAGDRFGCSVAVSGNLVVVGARDDDTGAENAGAAYLFDATSGALLRTFTNPTPAVNDFFGSS